jgi:hypothetical protein
MDVFKHWREEDYLELNPPYQRGDVWGIQRRQNLIKSILLGIPIPSIVINDRFSANWGNEIAVIDGKQRITTILMFLDGDLAIPSEWVGEGPGLIRFPQLRVPQQRGLRNYPLPITEGQLASVEAEEEVFMLVNYGGIAQGETDLE